METPSMSFPPKCALCSDQFPLNSLSSQDLESFQSVFESHVPEIAGLLEDDSSGLRGNTSALCGQCDVLLKEAARLHRLLETLNSQLHSIILSIRAKVVERSLQIKEDEEQETFLPFNEELPHIQSPTVVIKQEETDEDSSAFEFPDTEQQVSLSSPESSVDDYESDSYQPPSKSQRNVTLKTTGKKAKSTTCKKVSRPKMSKKKRSTIQEDTDDDPNSPNKHKRDKDFLCTLCSIHFKRKEDKFLHYESFHFKGASEDIPGECQLYSRICGKSSLTPGDLSRHNETFHESFFKFFCLGCTPHKTFTSIDLLQAHQPVHDSSLTSFPCCLCPSYLPVTFDTPLHLENHILRVHAHLLSTSTGIPLELQVNRTGPECGNTNSQGQQSTHRNRRFVIDRDGKTTDAPSARANQTSEQNPAMTEERMAACARALLEQKAAEMQRKLAANPPATPEEKAKAEAERKRRARANFTMKKQAADAARKRRAYRKLTREQKAEAKRKQAARLKLTPEQKAIQAKRERRARLRARTPERRAEAERKRQERAKFTAEQRALKAEIKRVEFQQSTPGQNAELAENNRHQCAQATPEQRAAKPKRKRKRRTFNPGGRAAKVKRQLAARARAIFEKKAD